ncbi:adhesion G protein-coupled receptor E1-like [Amphiura filiformis]|uniref:adhesion G protein-coupled receptor E1-like n=1 Tax=Amphiura filiformis TaxID=82378 RepID=UPI003B21B7A3
MNEPEITTQQITTQNMTPMKMDTTTTGVQSISAFENVASIFPYNSTPGIITNNSDLVSYLFEHKNREEDFKFNSEGDLSLTIQKEFLASGLLNGTGYITVVIKKTPTDDTEYWGDDSGEVYHQLGSALVSINLFSINGTLRKHEDEYNPLNISFPIKDPRSWNTSKQTKYSKLVCAFWDVENILWSQEGSLTYEADTNDKLQTCGFTHLTTFAVLFEFSKGVTNNYSPVIDKLVKVLIGTSLAALCIGLVICAILWKRTSLDKERILIHANLMVAMVLAYFMTLASSSAKSNQIACLAVTILRYNMLMSVFCCMLVEALHLYRMIVLVFGIERNFRVAYIVISWGVPMLMTTITASIGREHLYDHKRCWLTGQFIWAFIAPVIAILTINLVILVIIVCKTLGVAEADKQDGIHSIRIGLRSTVLLLPMVGVTWLIGLLGNTNINVAYVFDLLSALQGIYLVFVTCYVNSEVRNALKSEWRRRTGRVDHINAMGIAMSRLNTNERSRNVVNDTERGLTNSVANQGAGVENTADDANNAADNKEKAISHDVVADIHNDANQGDGIENTADDANSAADDKEKATSHDIVDDTNNDANEGIGVENIADDANSAADDKEKATAHDVVDDTNNDANQTAGVENTADDANNAADNKEKAISHDVVADIHNDANQGDGIENTADDANSAADDKEKATSHDIVDDTNNDANEGIGVENIADDANSAADDKEKKH